MFDGYLKIGDVELVNSARARGYGETAECPIFWYQDECEGLHDALLEPLAYTSANIASAPWYDLRNPESARFYGVTGAGFRTISNSTRYADFTEGITDGGVVGQPRRSGRSVRIRAWISADGEDALEYGMSWIESALRLRQCSLDASCGGSSVEFFVSCPPTRDSVPDGAGGMRPETDEEYMARVDPLRRLLHGVKAVSGPLEVETRQSVNGRHWGREVEFTLYAERPGVFSAPRSIVIPPTVPTLTQDAPYNLAPYPSAELASGTVIVAENLSTNPSVETNATGWAATSAVVSGATVGVTGGRSTEIAASGAASYLVTGTGSGVGVSDVIAQQNVTVAPVAGSRYSLTIWSAMLFTGSGGSGVSLGAKVEWRNSGGTVLRTDSMGSITSAFAGNVFALKSVAPPSGAVTARVIVTGRANFTASTVAKVFADALAVSIP